MKPSIKTAKGLIKDYYVYHGERVSCIEQIKRKTADSEYEEIGYLCKVSDRAGENKRYPVFTICTIEQDSSGENYATEYTHGDSREELKNSWINEAEEDDVDLFYDEDC